MPNQRATFETENVGACHACGARPNRESARFCSACGQDLSDGYAPAGSLMASYHRRRTSTLALTDAHPAARWLAREDGLTAFAFAFVTFSVVPFVGIVFCPVAFLLGICCFARRTTHARTGLRPAVTAIALSVMVSTAQIGLWWMLVRVPEGRF